MSLKIGVIQTPPITTSCSLDPNCPARGYGVDAALIACRFLQLNCTFVWYKSDEYGDSDENGVGSGMIGAIQRGEFDTGLPVFTPTYRRSLAVTFSNLYFYPDMVLTTRSPGLAAGSINLSLFYAFDWQVWSLFLVFMACFSLLLTVVAVKTPLLYTPFSGHTTGWIFFENCRLLLTQDFRPTTLHTSAVRFLVGTWILVALVFGSAYTGILFSQRITQRSAVPFDNLETFVDCLEEGRCRLITPSVAMSYHQLLTASGNELSNRVNRALLRYPVRITPQEDIPGAIMAENSIFLVWLFVREGVLFDTKGNDGCKFYIVDTPFKDLGAFPMRKNSTAMIERMSRLALAFQDDGFEIAVRRRYEKPASCHVRGTTSWSDEGHGLHSVRTIFYFFLMGTLSAMAAFPAEIFVDRVLNRDKVEVISIPKPR